MPGSPTMSKTWTPSADRVETALQLLQLSVASDIGREASVDFGVKARRSLADGVEPIRLLNVRLCL